MVKVIVVGFTLTVMLAVGGTTEAQACVTCSPQGWCAAADGNGAEKCRSIRIGKLRYCRLKGHCEISVRPGGGTLDPKEDDDDDSEIVGVLPPRRIERFRQGLFDERILRRGFHVASVRNARNVKFLG